MEPTDKNFPLKDELWLGIEWDDPVRGRHNGCVKGHVYFQTTENLSSATLIRPDKARFGVNIYDALVHRYFRNTGKAEQNEEEADAKKIEVEYDEEAYVETLKKLKKKIEFVGFNKIWRKITNLREIKEVSLPGLAVSDIGAADALGNILPNVQILSLESNLLYDWNQVFLIGRELRHLTSLSLSNNYLREVPDVREVPSILVNADGSRLPVSPLGIFGALKNVVLINMRLSWDQVSRVLPAMPGLEELLLCRNPLIDSANLRLPEGGLPELRLLNLEDTQQNDFAVLQPFASCSKLEHLVLNKNYYKRLGAFTGFTAITMLSIDDNNLEDPAILTDLARMPKLTSLRIGHNPFSKETDKTYVRQRAVAEIKALKKINGSELKRFERKDCEIYYLRRTFEDYFTLVGRPFYDYDFADFCKFAKANHPRIEELIKMYGNPFEVQPKQEEVKNDEYRKGKMVRVSLVATSGPSVGKPAVVKRFPDNTTIMNLKPIVGKLLGLDANKMALKYRNVPSDPFTAMDLSLIHI
eukprot:TRINITY_DN4721_c0_g1_i3.p1 TRINITY_DN4721_c0_g1~~TRINITY_DN4721_c0_g1_i3.p1  ORF type:complete len:527 (-),score=134.16 TRINITY_DN4721_c0_g1_i3:62-1642(-)